MAMSRSVSTPSGLPCSSTTGIIPQSLSDIIIATSRSGVSRPQQAGLAVIRVFSSMGPPACVGTVTVPKPRFPGREPTPPARCALSFVTGAGAGPRATLAPSRPDGDNPMKHPLAMALALALAATSLHAQAQDATPVAATAEQSNPFFAESPLPLHYPQFDRIRDSDFAPAFDRGMAEQLAEIAAIADNPAAPTFDNTIVAMEKSGQVLNRAASVFFNLVGADTNDAREKLRAEYASKFSAHSDAIHLNARLFARIKALHDGLAGSGLDAQEARLVERSYEDFVRAGANLSDADKARLKEMNAELARLATTFSQNVLAEVNDPAGVVDSRAELAGMS